MKKLVLGLFRIGLANILLLSIASAQLEPGNSEGSKGGGGGDASESRVDEIRADLHKWITNGGSAELKFPEGVTREYYDQVMLKLLEPQAVIVSFTTDKVYVNGVEKTCKNFVSTEDLLSYMQCNIERFSATSPSEQYKLVHHEYAGHGNLERNEGAASDYFISNQITEYLEMVKVLKLSVKKVIPDIPCGLVGTFEERIKDCSYLPNSKKGAFVLVSRRIPLESFGSHEIYFDTSTNLLWSQNLWNATYKNAEKNCKKYFSSSYIDLEYLKEFEWRLPTISEYADAELKEVRKHFKYMSYRFWSSTRSDFSKGVRVYDGNSGQSDKFTFNEKYERNYYRCVGTRK